MIENRYHLPMIKETINLLAKLGIYTKLDVQGAYNSLWEKD